MGAGCPVLSTVHVLRRKLSVEFRDVKSFDCEYYMSIVDLLLNNSKYAS